MKSLTGDQASLTERVFEEIRAAIISGELAPGSLHSVVGLASELGVSRTPVREALLKFAANGVVRFERSKGVRILKLSVKDVEDIYTLRLFLEVPSAYQAATRMSDSDRVAFRTAFEGMRQAAERGDEPKFQKHDLIFHETLLRAAGNRRVVEAVAQARSQMHALGLSTTRTRSLQTVFEVHARIFHRVEAKDADGASSAVLAHLLGTLHLLVEQATGYDNAEDRLRRLIPPWFGSSSDV